MLTRFEGIFVTERIDLIMMLVFVSQATTFLYTERKQETNTLCGQCCCISLNLTCNKHCLMFNPIHVANLYCNSLIKVWNFSWTDWLSQETCSNFSALNILEGDIGFNKCTKIILHLIGKFVPIQWTYVSVEYSSAETPVITWHFSLLLI